MQRMITINQIDNYACNRRQERNRIGKKSNDSIHSSYGLIDRATSVWVDGIGSNSETDQKVFKCDPGNDDE